MRRGAFVHAAAPIAFPAAGIARVIFVRPPYKNAARSGKRRLGGGVMRILQSAWTAAAVLALASSWAMAQTTVYVDDDSACPGAGTVGNPYCRIQDGICAVRGTGGTVMVKPGAY